MSAAARPDDPGPGSQVSVGQAGRSDDRLVRIMLYFSTSVEECLMKLWDSKLETPKLRYEVQRDYPDGRPRPRYHV